MYVHYSPLHTSIYMCDINMLLLLIGLPQRVANINLIARAQTIFEDRVMIIIKVRLGH